MTRRLFTIGGGVMFVGSMLFFVASYEWRFTASPEPSGGTAAAIVVDLVLFTLFSMHHSLLPRDRFKRWVQHAAGPDLERSVYVWIASVLFVLTCAYWQPVAGMAWQSAGEARWALRLGQAVGVALSIYSARRIDSLDLAGMRQVMKRGRVPHAEPVLDAAGPYAFVRHPIYFGWLLVVWLAPTMTGTRMVFAAVSTFYLIIAVPFEERDLTRRFPGDYDAYRSRVRWRMLPFVY